MKIICGDSSDNIKKCFPRVGKKTAEKYIADRELLQKKLNENPEYMAIFKKNQLLIDFKHIPANLVQQTIDTYFL